MGSLKGFMEIDRSLPNLENAITRIQHVREFVEEPKLEHQKDQAARCMDCGVPFCHSACPLGNLIPEFNEAVYNNNWKEAYEILISTNNFPEFTGRICPAPCEASCVLSINSDAVTIEYVEKSVIERAFREGYVIPKLPSVRSNKKIAIIGSGPAGLACADQLNQAGHNITVFEKSDRVGGLLRYGIPDFKLAKEIVQRRIKLLEEEGIVFNCGVNVGLDISPKKLKQEFDAIVLCGGSEQPRDLNIEGRQLKGIHFAMDFLTQCNKRNAGDDIQDNIEIRDKNIVVIGGGDTGSDCIGNSNRLGAKSILQIELLGKPAKERTLEDPWPLWPKTLKTSSSHEEGCDRKWSVQTKKFVSEDGVNVSGMEVVDLEWKKNNNGEFEMIEIVGSDRVIPVDRVFLAMGFIHPLKKGLISESGVRLTQRGNVYDQDYMTTKENIFVAGDMRRGQSLVVWAIAEGRECASKVHAHITKE